MNHSGGAGRPQAAAAKAAPAAAADWSEIGTSVRSVQAAVGCLRTALLDSAAGHSDPALEESAAALARALAEHQPRLQLASQHAHAMPAALRLELQQLGAEIQHLAEWNTRLAAAGQRALALLLPEAARLGYTQLAGGRASPFAGNGSGSGYLKA